MKRDYMNQILNICAGECGRKPEVPVKRCQHKDCVLWPYAGGKRKRPWPDRVQALTYPPHKALEMYREGLK